MGITFVGGTTDGKNGATSGTSTIALNSGLTGGSDSSVSAGDLVIAVFATGSTADRTLSITDGAVAYTLIDSERYANGSSFDTNLRVAYKFMPASPDTSTTFGATGNAQDAGTMAVFVLRGVDPTVPLDVAAVGTTGTGTGRPDPSAITPLMPGAVMVVVGASAQGTGANFTSSDLSNFKTQTWADTNDSTLGIGSKDWTSGAFDPAQFGGGTTNATDSWAAITIALKPALDKASLEHDESPHRTILDRPNAQILQRDSATIDQRVPTDPKAVLIGTTGRANETDTAFSLQVISIAAGRADETDTAFALVSAQPAGRANETDVAFNLILGLPTGRANETDTAFALSSTLSTGRADETDECWTPAVYDRAVSGVLDRDGNQIYLRGLRPVEVATADQAIETDTAFALKIAHAIGLATETDVAFAPAFGEGVGRSNETDTAFSLAIGLSVGRANELDLAFRLAVSTPSFAGVKGFIHDFASNFVH